jgi:integrase
VGWINSQSYRTSTKDNLRLVVRKLVQYAKFGSAKRKPVLYEVVWLISVLFEAALRPGELLGITVGCVQFKVNTA